MTLFDDNVWVKYTVLIDKWLSSFDWMNEWNEFIPFVWWDRNTVLMTLNFNWIFEESDLVECSEVEQVIARVLY